MRSFRSKWFSFFNLAYTRQQDGVAGHWFSNGHAVILSQCLIMAGAIQVNFLYFFSKTGVDPL